MVLHSDVMARFMNRSIDLLEEIAGDLLEPRGYVFLARERKSLPKAAASAGSAELVCDRAEILRRYPFLTHEVGAMLHVPRAGWLDSAALGRRLLEAAPVRVLRDRVVDVDRVGGAAGRKLGVRLASGERFDADAFVIAAGPYCRRVGAMVGVDLPVHNQLHAKMAFAQDIVPPDAPLMIWEDGVHFRPHGDELLGIWTHKPVVMDDPEYPPPFDPAYPSELLRGLGRMVPGLERCAPGVVDGGYYCRTHENRPLIGPLSAERTYVVGALSGFGIMASQAAGELLAAHVVGAELPDYATAFSPARYDDPAYRPLDTPDGQL